MKLIPIKRLQNLWLNKALVRKLIDSDGFVFAHTFPPGHFYSPLPDLREIRRNADQIVDRSAQSLPGIDLNLKGQLQLLERLSKFANDIPFPVQRTPGFRYCFQNAYFSFGDAMVLYAILAANRPSHVVEIGSGFSSAAMLDANALRLSNKIRFTFVDPHMERLRTLITEQELQTCTLVEDRVQAVDFSLFDILHEDDILLIDSSHVGKCQSDVLHIIFNVLPRLQKGVLVHFHDVMWPFEYPLRWLEGGRAWNEAYMLRAFLQYNSAFEIYFFNSYMAQHHSALLEEKLPGALRVPDSEDTITNSSLWLRKCI